MNTVKTHTLHAHFDGKVLRPEEPLDLKPNVRYRITIEDEESIAKQSIWEVLSEFSGKLTDPKIGLKSTTITCTAHQNSKKGSSMNADRFFMDTAYVLALLNQNDKYHDQAKAILPSTRVAYEVCITDAI
jgi:hypothetical protein